MWPNTWPPTTPYGGQTLEQAPQRMQRSVSAKSGDSRMAERPLSTSTTWNFRLGSDGGAMKLTYDVAGCPVALGARRARTAIASSSVGTTFSMPATTTWIGGTAVTSSALPSLVTSMMLPVSTTSAFAPEMP